MNVLIFDFETTGLSPIKDEIIEIGAIKLKLENNAFRIIDELSVILKSNVVISKEITQITGITPLMQKKEGISQEEGFLKLEKLIDNDTLLVAYNIQFDISFLAEFYRKNKKVTYNFENNLLDVMAIYKDRHKYPHKLADALVKYNISLVNSHRALDDAKATYELLKSLKKEKPNISKYINVIGYNKKFGVFGTKFDHVEYVVQSGGKGEIESL